jgi:hypothetical protein
MQLDEALDQRQADAQPPLGNTRRIGDLHEHVEDRSQHVARNANAVVAHADPGEAVGPIDGHADVASGLCILCCIVEQIREDLRQAHAVAAHAQAFAGQDQFQAVPGRGQQRAAELHRVGDDAFERQHLELELDLSARDARHFHEVVDQPHHVLDLALHHLVMGPGFVGTEALPLQQGQRRAQRGERIAQLVGQRRQEYRLALIGLAQSLQDAAQLVLAGAGAQRCAHRTDQREDADRAFDDREVRRHLHGIDDGHRIGARARKNQHRQIGPRRLPVQDCGHLAESGIGERFLGDQQRSRAAFDFQHQFLDRCARVRDHAGAFEHGLGQRGIFAGHRSQQHALRIGNRHLCDHGVLLSRSSSAIGTPVRIPRNCRSG